MSPAISVIVPVYKAEKYLDRCVKSILEQTFQDFELILINDGSPDACPAMCDAYAAQYPCVKAIHSPNRGVSSARNLGLKAAQGKYVKFVDSDDYLGPDHLKTLFEAAERSGASWVWGRQTWVTKNGMGKEQFSGVLDGIAELTKEQAMKAFRRLYFAKVLFSVWNKLYIRENIQKRFNETMDMGEDVVFNLEYLVSLDGTIAVIDNADYFYNRLNEQSALVIFQNYQANSFLCFMNAVKEALACREGANQNGIYKSIYMEQLIFETQYMIYRNKGKIRRQKLREYLLNDETQRVAREADPKQFSRTYQVALFCIRRRWLTAYMALFGAKYILKPDQR